MFDIPTGTVTFLFTDIEGSTSMWDNHPRQMEAALKLHDQILRSAVEGHEGYVFKMIGDACCAAFTTAKDALEATLSAQRALLAERWGENIKVRVRAALHTGLAEERDGDYFGPPVNRVARLMGTGHGAGRSCSRTPPTTWCATTWSTWSRGHNCATWASTG